MTNIRLSPRFSIVHLAGFFLALFLTAGAGNIQAQWSGDPTVNTPVCTAAYSQTYPTVVSDGSGGAIITWVDYRGAAGDIYAQRVNFSGVAQWTANGVAICTAANGQGSPIIVSDGSGGAIITWLDYRGGANADIYAQRISSSGTVSWTADGVAICTAASDQTLPAIVSDGSGGAIIAWQDYRSGTNYDIYAQRIPSAGAVSWTANGVAICTAANDQTYPVIASTGSAIAIITWQDYRSGTNYDVYAQRIISSGAAQWTANGVVVSTATNDQMIPAIVSDGSTGAIITWPDFRNGTYSDIFAQRVNVSGVAQWTANGVAISTASYDQVSPVIVSDGLSGAIITWQDYRNLSYDIYTQRINSSGITQWTSGGIAVSTATGDQTSPAVVTDGSGGVITTWQDTRNGTYDIYIQRTNSSGTMLWTANGAGISTAASNQIYPTIASDGAGGAITTWSDYRSGSYDIYAQNVERNGALGAPPKLVMVRDVRADQGGKVTVAWDRSTLDRSPGLPITHYSIWRGIDLSASLMQSGGTSAPAAARDFAADSRKKIVTATGTTYWEPVGTVEAHYLSNYSFTASTLSDSSAGGTPYYKFFVSAHTSDPATFWDSSIDSGYSADNIPPLAPLNLAGTLAGGNVVLHWNANAEADLMGYSVYRSRTAGFNPDTVAALGSTSDTSYTDSGVSGGNYYYAIRAIDIHDNLSSKSNEVPIVLVGAGVEETRPLELALYGNYPNPFGRNTVISYALPVKQYVTLKVFNMLGQEVATLVNGVENAGLKTAAFDAGKLPSGIYTYRLSVMPEGTSSGKMFVSVKKMLVLR